MVAHGNDAISNSVHTPDFPAKNFVWTTKNKLQTQKLTGVAHGSRRRRHRMPLAGFNYDASVARVGAQDMAFGARAPPPLLHLESEEGQSAVQNHEVLGVVHVHVHW